MILLEWIRYGCDCRCCHFDPKRLPPLGSPWALALEDLKAKGLEVIYVPGDRDEASFMEYFGEMPWLAVDFNDKAASGFRFAS